MAGKAEIVLPLNREVIRAAKAIDRKQTEYQIGDERGLKLRVLPSGIATYVMRYSIGEGRHRRRVKMALGRRDEMSLDAARKQADQIRRQVASGIDPAAEVVAINSSLTLRELFNNRLSMNEKGEGRAATAGKQAKERKRAPSTLTDYARILERDVFGVLGDKPAGSISPREIAAVLAKVESRSVHVAHRARSALGSTFRWALQRQLIESNPCVGMGFTAASEPRTRVLTDAELRGIWTGMDRTDASLSDAVKAVVKLAILTAQRRSEVVGMRVSELSALDGDRPRWLIPAIRMKRKDRDQLVPLSTQAAAIIIGALPGARDGCVFPSDLRRVKYQATPRVPHINPESISRAMARLCDTLIAAEILKVETIPHYRSLDFSDVVLHDMRKVAATWMRENGVQADIVDLVLHHAKSGVTGSHYDFAKLETPVRSALATWANHVASVTDSIDCISVGNYPEFRVAAR